jgi:multiple sugar transport system substrate-binding protein
MKKLLKVFTLMLFCLMFTGCGGSKSAEKPEVTLNIKTPSLTMTTAADADISIAKDFLEKAAADFAAQYTDAKVTINLVEFAQENENDAVSGTFGTEDAPDVLYEGYFNMATYIHSGYVVPLDDIISDELKADISQSWWESSQLNGKTYMMPYLGLENTLCYNKQMFINAGLERFVTDENVVVSWTIDEWNEILAALKSTLPPTSYAMMMYAGDNQGDTHIMTLLRMYGCELFDENGHFNLETEEGLKALQQLSDWEQAGYYPSHAQDLVSNDIYNLFRENQLAICFANAALESALENSSEMAHNVGYVNFPSLTDGGLNTTFITGFEVYDNGNADKLAAAKAFVKYIYDSKYIDYEAGGIPANASVSNKYADSLVSIQKYIDVSDCGVSITGNNPNWRGVREVFYPNIQDLIFGEKSIADIAASIDKSCNAAIDEGYATSRVHE